MKSAFFNSIDRDRVYFAEDWAGYFSRFLGNGVFASPAVNMQVKVQTAGGLKVRINEGDCYINGYAGYEDGTDVLSLDHGDGKPRIDRIVVRLDHTRREIYPAVIKGTPADEPSPPDIVRNGMLYDLCLAEVTVSANTLTIGQENIKDTRTDTELCGIVKGLVDQIDTTDLFAQYQAAWDAFTGSLTTEDGKIYINTADEQARNDILMLKRREIFMDMFRII